MQLRKTLLLGLVFIGSIVLNAQDPLWLEAIQGTNDEEGLDVATDNDGHPIACGYFYSDVLTAGNMTMERNANSCDAYVIKYNLNGDPIWMDNPGGTFWQEAWAVTSDNENNIYVTGRFMDNFQFADTTILSSGAEDGFLIKYDEYGNELWSVGMHSYGITRGCLIMTDNDGNILVGGRFEDTLQIGELTFENNGSLDMFIAKFSPDGEMIWAKTYGGADQDFIMGLTTDKLNNIYFTGGAHSNNIQFGAYWLNNYPYVRRLAFIVQMNPDGNVTWAEGHNDGYDQQYMGVAVDTDQNIYTAGYFKEVFNFGSYSIYGSAGHFDMFIAKYNSSHEHQWIKKINTPYYGRTDHLIIDKDENVIMEAVHQGELIVEGNIIHNQGEYDMCLLKWDRDANLLWTLPAGGVSNERTFGLVCGPFNNLYFTGYFSSPELKIGDLKIQNNNPGYKDAYIAALGTPCPPPDPAFIFSIEEFEVEFTAIGTADSYHWDFGDGNTSTETNPVHTYDSIGTYEVCLTVQDICGQNIDCKEINICSDPIADFSWAANDKYVAFYQASTFAEDYQWNFGDGTHSYEAEPIHEYDEYGIYYVDLIVYNQCGADQHFDTVYILAPLMCNFSFTLDDMGIVQFQNESVEAKNYFWNFGDGTTSTEQSPTHHYETNGIYECCLAIETELGSYTYCAEITVKSIPDEETTTFKLYVDPVGQSLVIDIPDDGLYKIFIYDTWGKPAYSNEVQLPGNSVYEVGLTNLPAGIYIVIVESASLSEKTKVIVPSF